MSKLFSCKDDLPQLSEFGFKIIKCPPNIFNPIIDYYYYKKSKGKDRDAYVLYDHPKFIEWIIDCFKPIFEEWVNEPLEISHLWGIKSYKKGTKVNIHREPLLTHHVSSNIIISQDKTWPFYIWDHKKTLHTIYLNPGDIILYEGAKIPHGRLEEIKGNYCDLIYLHYALKNWEFVGKN